MSQLSTFDTYDTLLAVHAHPDDTEMHSGGLLVAHPWSTAIIASDGEGTTLNYSPMQLC